MPPHHRHSPWKRRLLLQLPSQYPKTLHILIQRVEHSNLIQFPLPHNSITCYKVEGGMLKHDPGCETRNFHIQVSDRFQNRIISMYPLTLELQGNIYLQQPCRRQPCGRCWWQKSCQTRCDGEHPPGTRIPQQRRQWGVPSHSWVQRKRQQPTLLSSWTRPAHRGCNWVGPERW